MTDEAIREDSADEKGNIGYQDQEANFAKYADWEDMNVEGNDRGADERDGGDPDDYRHKPGLFS